MDHKEALQRVEEAADLAAMIEELISASAGRGLSPASVSGIRLTMRNVRRGLLAGRDALRVPESTPVVEGPAKQPEDAEKLALKQQMTVEHREQAPVVPPRRSFPTMPESPIRRREIRASIEKMLAE